MKRIRSMAFVIAIGLPFAACEAGGVEEEGMDTELETVEPAGETGATDGLAMNTWDTDTNQRLTREEWGGWYGDQSVYEDWNADANEGLDDTEFSEGAFGVWDADDNQELTETEWNEGATGWFGEGEYGEWGEWDSNGDSVLDTNEVAEGFEREGLYDRVDRDSDALIDDEELADMWFDFWDVNDDQEVDTTEWDEVGAEWSRMTGAGM